MKIEYIYDSKKGVAHEENQDRLVFLDTKDFSLFFMFDGVSSAISASSAVNIATDFIKKNSEQYLKGENFLLEDLILALNNELLNSGLIQPFMTYCCVCLSSDGGLQISNVGNTRIYGVSEQHLSSYTIDDAYDPPSNVVTKCLGMDGINREDLKRKIIKFSDNRILLCTDGFYEFLEENKKRFYELLNFKNLSNIAKSLKKEIINNKDDSTYLLLDLYV